MEFKYAMTNRSNKEHDASGPIPKAVTGKPRQPKTYRPLDTSARKIVQGRLPMKDAEGVEVGLDGMRKGKRKLSGKTAGKLNAPNKLAPVPNLKTAMDYSHLKIALDEKHPLRGVQKSIENRALHADDRSKSKVSLTKSNPGTALLTGAHVGGQIDKLRARKGAFAAKHPFQAMVPFRGMGSEGQKKLDELKSERKKMNKKALLRFTEGGKKSLRDKAKDLERHSARQQKMTDENPGTSYALTGDGVGSVINKLKARKAAFTADHGVQAAIPFRGMGGAGQKSLDKLKDKKKK